MNNLDSNNALSLGEQCRQAREARNLSLEEVAKRIALRPAILQLIENNQFIQPAIPAAFMKGYVRNYARFLKIPESVWKQVDFGEEQKNDLGKNARATRSVNHYSSHNRWVGWLSLLVVLIVAGMTGLWWWENYKQSNAERESLVQSYVETTPHSLPTESVASISSPVVSHSIEISTGMEATSVTIPPELTKNAQDNVALPNQSVTSAGVLQAEINKLSERVEKTSVDQLPVSTASTMPSTMPELYIEVMGPCWISVQNEQGKVLAQKEYKQGDTLSFNEGTTYSLIVGAPGNVKMVYKGNDYPLKVDGRVARFKLPQ
ncbi:hypothetical protein I926_03575 [Pasteurella multocida subsp. multocida OH4807]|nr:hypothetical protein I926_03575 [Pasteurella multocida subsp. multocida OH4807]